MVRGSRRQGARIELPKVPRGEEWGDGNHLQSRLGLGSVVSFTSKFLGGAPAANAFFAHFKAIECHLYDGNLKITLNSKVVKSYNILWFVTPKYKKAQLSLTNPPRDAKACQKLLQFDVLTTLSLTILTHLHSFSCCCVRNLRNPEKFTGNSNLWSSRSSKVIDLGVNGKPKCDFILVINCNFSRICYRFRDIHNIKDRKLLILPTPFLV